MSTPPELHINYLQRLAPRRLAHLPGRASHPLDYTRPCPVALKCPSFYLFYQSSGRHLWQAAYQQRQRCHPLLLQDRKPLFFCLYFYFSMILIFRACFLIPYLPCQNGSYLNQGFVIKPLYEHDVTEQEEEY